MPLCPPARVPLASFSQFGFPVPAAMTAATPGRLHSLLQNLVLTGRIVVVGDAIFCQWDRCEQLLDSGGDYLIAVTENQPTLLREIELEIIAEPAALSLSRPPSACC